jgi:O-antigen/teichoic acid export membrane protein
MELFKIIEKYFGKSTVKSTLSIKIKKNIIQSFAIKGGSVVTNLAIVPITLNYIDVKQYGIWLVVSSLASWMSFFDIGLGHGLRNSLIKSILEENITQSRIYISTTVVVLSGISFFLFLSILFFIDKINWWNVLNIRRDNNLELSKIILVVLGSFCLQLVFQVQNIILSAHHESAKIGLIGFIGQLFTLAGILILKQFYDPQLLYLVLILSLVPLCINFIASVYLFTTKYSHLKPSVRFFRYKSVKDLYKTSFLFFLIQINAIILFQSNNIIISRYINPESVSEYNITQKLFSIVVIIFLMIITPYWSGYAESYEKSDFTWIRKSLSDIRRYSFFLTIISILILLFSDEIFNYWLQDLVKINFSLKFAVFVYNILFMWQTIHVYFLNGIGKIKLQAILVTICTIVNVYLSILFVKIYGTAGVVYSNIIVFFIMGSVFYIQTELVLKGKAFGIWLK